MKENIDREKSRQLNRIFVLSAALAVILALMLVGFYYGCAKMGHPQRPTSPPSPSGVQSSLIQFGYAMHQPWPGSAYQTLQEKGSAWREQAG
jgi:hypothetical protein